ncbi:MAG: ABC transporter ATP-binding protein [Firmicutes bacterium]|nr:ABC transporter ATP-binding protein [Bacillota bacterium]
MNDYAVITRDLTKQFGTFVAVDRLNLTVKKGEIFGFLGPNGAGKSTVIRMLCGLLDPTLGDGWVLGYNLKKEPDKIKMEIGYMSQRFSLYEDLSVKENLNFYAGIYQLPVKQRAQRLKEIVALAGLEGREEELVANLSGGWKQRLALGCAILHQPAMVFLDEPTGSVDPAARRQFWDIIYELANQGTTVVVTTHYMDEAEHCDRIGFMYGGKMIAVGSPDEIKLSFWSGELIELEADNPLHVLDRVRQYPRVKSANLHGSFVHAVVESAATVISILASELKEQGIEVTRISPVSPSLEDVFVNLVERERQAEDMARIAAKDGDKR